MTKFTNRALVVAIALAAMCWAAVRSDINLIGSANAAWCKGCCGTSADCAGSMVCYRSFSAPPSWSPCDSGEFSGYCNDSNNPGWTCPGGGDGKGPGDILP